VVYPKVGNRSETINMQFAATFVNGCLTESNQSWTLGYTFHQNTNFDGSGIFVKDLISLFYFLDRQNR
jgi:hypothetical protein